MALTNFVDETENFRAFINAVNEALILQHDCATAVAVRKFHTQFIQPHQARHSSAPTHLSIRSYLGSHWDYTLLDDYAVPVRGIVACACRFCMAVKPQIVGNYSYYRPLRIGDGAPEILGAPTRPPQLQSLPPVTGQFGEALLPRRTSRRNLRRTPSRLRH